jgi:hypothetical protein
VSSLEPIVFVVLTVAKLLPVYTSFSFITRALIAFGSALFIGIVCAKLARLGIFVIGAFFGFLIFVQVALFKSEGYDSIKEYMFTVEGNV